MLPPTREVWKHPPSKTQNFSILYVELATSVGDMVGRWSGQTQGLNNKLDKVVISANNFWQAFV